MRLILRCAELDDIPAMSELIRCSVRGLSPEYSPGVIEASLVRAFGVDTTLIHDRTYFAVIASDADTDETHIIGCGGWSKRRKLYGNDNITHEACDLLDPSREAARIRAFFVHPQWARKGIGSLLMNHCEAEARAAGFTRLELGATLPGVHLYRRHGFAPLEEMSFPLGDGMTLPLVRMAKQLA